MLEACKKKTVGCCQELVDDKDAQARLRENYAQTVTVATSFDTGNLLLLNYLYIITYTLQKRKANITNSCNQFKYKVPQIDEIGNMNGSFDLCCETFKDLFKVGCTWLQGLQRRKMYPAKAYYWA
jgi:hypothetical protein